MRGASVLESVQLRFSFPPNPFNSSREKKKHTRIACRPTRQAAETAIRSISCSLQLRLKVIPLKLFYYKTFFETLRNEHLWYEHYKNAIKKMRSPCLFTRQQALKKGYFYWLRVKSSNHLHTELNLGYLKGTKFCLESKASFIGISRFWLPGCGNIVLFRTVPWLTWGPRLGQNTPSWGLFSKKRRVLL